MNKTVSFIDQNPKWEALREYTTRIESFASTSPGLVIENCKSIIESILKTILVEVQSKTELDLKDDEIGKLFKEVKTTLHLEDKGYTNIIGSFTKAICEFRNKLGETSHGKDIYTLESSRNALFEDELHFLLSTTDNISFFILSYYQNLYPGFRAKKEELKYPDSQEFNEWFDSREPIVTVTGIELLPSEVLFNGDLAAYKINLDEYKAKDELIEGLRISPNFASTHKIIEKLSQYNNFSEAQIDSLNEVYGFNNQVNWISDDPDVKGFFKMINSNNQRDEDQDIVDIEVNQKEIVLK